MFTLTRFSIPPLAAGILIAAIGLDILRRNPRSTAHRALAFFCASLTVWLGCYFLMYCSVEAESALRWARIGFIGISFIAFTNLYFNLTLLKISRPPTIIWGNLAFSAFLACLSQTPFIYKSVDHFFWGFYPQAGIAYPLFMTYYALTWGWGLYLLYQEMMAHKAARDFLGFNQVKYVFLAWLGGSLGIVDFLPKYGVPIYPFAYLVALYWVLVSAVALTKYRALPDMYFITRRILIGSCYLFAGVALFTLSWAVSTVLKALNIGVNPSFLAIGAALVLGILIQPLSVWIKRVIDKSFFPEYSERKQRLADMAHDILLARNPVEFNRILLDNIFSLFKIIKASFYVLDDQRGDFILLSSAGWGAQHTPKQESSLSRTGLIAQHLSENDYLSLDDVRGDFSSTSDPRVLAREMLELEASLCIPVKVEGFLKGFFIFGDKESGLPYSKEDIKSLNTLSAHTAVALEKFELNKKWNEKLVQNHQLTGALNSYVGSSVADEILRKINQDQGWQGERRYVTVLVADLRGFSTLSEKHPPEQIAEFLNEFFSEMTHVIDTHGGTIDKFMGDAVLVVFGAPIVLDQPEQSAVACALEMQQLLSHINRRREENGQFTLGMGIGICAGEVVAGNIGSAKRRDYTVIGDAVNSAARLQSCAEAGEILVSLNVLVKVRELVNFKRMFPMKMKGKSQPVEYAQILSLIPPPDQSSAEPQARFNLI